MNPADALNVAARVIREEREQLLALLAQVRRSQAELQERLRLTERALDETSRQLQTLRNERNRATTRTLGTLSLREQEQALQQQRTILVEQLAAQNAVMRRLSIVAQQSEVNHDYLTAVSERHDENPRINHLAPARLLQAQEDERQRLAREVHDGPAQVLANAIFELEFCSRLLGADPSRLSAELERLKSNLREGLSEVRSFIFDLRPGPLADFGLITTLRRYAESFESRFHISIELQLEEDLAGLAASQEVAIFRIVQEALQNVRKHSGATQVQIRMRRDGNLLLVEVRDNGRGFDPQPVRSSHGQHYGLTSMRERARLIGADLTVEGEQNRGTVVCLRVPLGRAGS